VITHLEHLTTQHRSARTHEQHTSLSATTYAKCDTNNTLCDDHDDTCVTMLETLEMSVTHVYMVIPTHLRKDYLSKPLKLAFVQHATVDM